MKRKAYAPDIYAIILGTLKVTIIGPTLSSPYNLLTRKISNLYLSVILAFYKPQTKQKYHKPPNKGIDTAMYSAQNKIK